MADREIRDIKHEKGFTTKFIKRFDKDWTEVVLAAKKLKERKKRYEKI